MPQIAVIADPDVAVDELTLGIWVDAADRQLKEICNAWGVPYTPVIYYRSVDGLSPNECRIANIKTTLDAPGALGYHDDLAGVIFSRILFTNLHDTPVTLTHEDGEEGVDPTCDLYDSYDDKDDQAREICDRVEGDVYTVQGSVGEVSRDVPVSNWLYPSAFDPNGKKPFDKMGTLETWNGMTAGGYTILRSKATGDVSDIFAQRRRLPRLVYGAAEDTEHGQRSRILVARRLSRPDSRLMRRLRGTGPLLISPPVARPAAG
jgi:hypothetical protein